MSNPHEPGHMSVTFKADEPGGKFNDAKSPGTWIVIHGSPAEVREQIIEVFQMESEWETPLYDLINEATRLFKSTGNINGQLGGRVIPASDRTSDSTPPQSGSAWERAQGGSPAEPQVDPNVVRLTAEIEAQESRASLKELFARNKAAFDANADLMSAYMAKGKSLPS